MFKYINNILVPFDCFVKFNWYSSYCRPTIEKLVLVSTDLKQKEDINHSTFLLFNSLNITSLLPVFGNLKKSVAKFKTRKGELSSAKTFLRGLSAFAFLDTALKNEMYFYLMSLKKGRIGFGTENNLTLSFPDVKYLFYFKNSVIHNLIYTVGFDVSVSLLLPNVQHLLNEDTSRIFLSGFTIFSYATKRK